MRVLVGCEYSGIVRDAFRSHGHDATSCDLIPTESPGPHHTGDVRDILNDGWDLLIAFPPCTHLAVSGARWFKEKQTAPLTLDLGIPTEPETQGEAIEFVRTLMDAPIPRIAIENPVSVLSTAIRPPDQIVHPWWFGHPLPKATCLWLNNLPPLTPTRPVTPVYRYAIRDQSPSAHRKRDRSRTYPGMAEAMAEQWGSA